MIFSSHRAHGHFLAYCDDVEGLGRGIARPPHGGLWRRRRHAAPARPQSLHQRHPGRDRPECGGRSAGRETPTAAAPSWLVFLGDGTLGEGVVYESMNLASLWSLPVLFVLEDNQYAQSTPKVLEHAGRLAARPLAYGIATHVSGGHSQTMADALTSKSMPRPAPQSPGASARRSFFLALHTYRLAPHSKGDDTRRRRGSAAWSRDPLVRLGPDCCRRCVQLIHRRSAWPGRRRSAGEAAPSLAEFPRAPMAARLTYLESLRAGLHAILEETRGRSCSARTSSTPTVAPSR